MGRGREKSTGHSRRPFQCKKGMLLQKKPLKCLVGKGCIIVHCLNKLRVAIGQNSIQCLSGYCKKKSTAFTAKKILSCRTDHYSARWRRQNPGINTSCCPSLVTLSANFNGKEAPHWRKINIYLLGVHRTLGSVLAHPKQTSLVCVLASIISLMDWEVWRMARHCLFTVTL